MTPHVRPYTEADAPFVRHAWIRSAATLTDRVMVPGPHGELRKPSAIAAKRRAEHQFERATKLVVFDADEPTVLLGFAALGPADVLHFVYVTPAFRKIGIWRALRKRMFGGRPFRATTYCEKWRSRFSRWGCSYVKPRDLETEEGKHAA